MDIKEILWGKLLKKPIGFADVGIGGGERFTYADSRGNTGYLNMINTTYNIRLSNDSE